MPIMIGRPMVKYSLFLWRIKRFLKSFLIIGKMKIPANKTEKEKRLPIVLSLLEIPNPDSLSANTRIKKSKTKVTINKIG